MATRSHPPTLLKLAERTIGEHELFGRGQRVLCGVSGGPDSTALLHVLAILRKRLGHELFAVGVDHGLRTEARRELEVAAEQARVLGVPFEAVSLIVRSGANLQERAREARHRALQHAASALGAGAIALGHTADDRAETFLLRLLRGAGPRGLAVMPAAAPGVLGDVRLIRPLVAARRTDVSAHLARHRLTAASDPSNEDRRFLRVRVRRELLPLLEELSPQIVAHLCSLAEMLDGDGDPLAGFGRAQRAALEKALRDGLRGASRAITLRLRGGRELFVRFSRPTRRGRI